MLLGIAFPYKYEGEANVAPWCGGGEGCVATVARSVGYLVPVGLAIGVGTVYCMLVGVAEAYVDA